MSFTQAKARGGFVAAALTLLLAPASLSATEPHFFTTGQGQKRAIELPSEAALAIRVAATPRHGTLFIQRTVVVYSPVAGYFGRDSFEIEAQGASGELTLLRYEMRVLPRYLPIAGKLGWSEETVGLYDDATQSFILCAEIVTVDQQLACWRYPVLGLDPAALVPVLWPTKAHLETPALFDPEKGSLHLLTLSGNAFNISESLDLPELAGAWPLFGDWNGTGRKTLAMVFEDGRVYQLGPGPWTLWPVLRPAEGGDAFVWPIRVPATDGKDAVAWVDTTSGKLTWLSCPAASGCTTGSLAAHNPSDYRRPLRFDGLRGKIQFLEELASGLELIPDVYTVTVGNPQTIPVKFPDDPPGGG